MVALFSSPFTHAASVFFLAGSKQRANYEMLERFFFFSFCFII